MKYVFGLTCAAVVIWSVFSADVAPSDLLAFLGGARSIVHGASPYVDPSTPALWAGHAFVYPYATGWTFIPLTIVASGTAKLLFFLISFAALVTAWWLFTDQGRSGHAAGLIMTIGAEPVVRGLQLGTINALLLVGLAAAWFWRDRGVPLVLSVIVVITAKLFLAPMLCWLLLTRRRVQGALAVAATAALVVAGCWAAHIGIVAFARMLSTLSGHEAGHSSSVTAGLQALGAPATVAGLGALLVAVGLIAGGALLGRVRADERFVFVSCILASLALSPIVWSHYYTLLVAVPLLLRWSVPATLTALACSWAIARPDAATELSVLHTFPGSGYVWAALLTVPLAVARLRGRAAAG